LDDLMPKLGFLVSGTDTGVGKTTLACGIASTLKGRGLRVGVMKPAETGCEVHDGDLAPTDAIALRNAAESNEPLELICPYRYALPLAPAAAADLERRAAPDLNQIRHVYERLASPVDVMLVEGAGGIAVPLTWRSNYADLALALNLDLILVVANRLGCINSTLLSLEYAARRGIIIKGYILNDVDAQRSVAAITNARSLERLTSVSCLGEVQHDEVITEEICHRIISSAF
jgi:dethiobiotin synthetase